MLQFLFFSVSILAFLWSSIWDSSSLICFIGWHFWREGKFMAMELKRTLLTYRFLVQNRCNIFYNKLTSHLGNSSFLSYYFSISCVFYREQTFFLFAYLILLSSFFLTVISEDHALFVICIFFQLSAFSQRFVHNFEKLSFQPK